MNNVLNWTQRSYHSLLRLYPASYRSEFGPEMGMVFEEISGEAAQRGNLPLLMVYLREIRDLPLRVMGEHFFVLKEMIIRRMQMSEGKTWRIVDRKTALWAAAPPLVIALGIVLKQLAIWPVYYKVAFWRMYLAIGIYSFATLLLITAGALAVIRRLPDWGYTWAGAGLMSGTLLLQTLVEEISEGSPQVLIPPVVETSLVVFIFLMGLSLIAAAAWRGWPQAGLVSIGFAVTAGLNLFDAMSYAPFNRYDLALLAGISGVLMAAMIYAYVKKDDRIRIMAISGIWLLNMGAGLLLIHVHQQHTISYGIPDLLIPMTVLLTGVLLAGPVIGVLGKPVRKRLVKV